MKRRVFLTTAAATASTFATGLARGPLNAASGSFEVQRSVPEWKAMLSDLEYKVMREDGTEPAYSSKLHDLKEDGTYLCRGCDLPIYSSADKFDSGTGWPSFTRPIADDAVRTKPDRSLFATRTEVHCRRCGSHLGHIFDDGPEPTGKRHCLNGVSLKFTPTNT
ncbi:peptide-methionine (R)-S-oxide reductase MsrB [Pseudooceanicola aestuarii]|uniref:peptide-methionine (R)-S-oxide reductase MsrB n=1 Tax=Pseudooceanicola aestuarii TaxID=2697319 RepID=UPI0013D78338|nr:peptide-methionine (R)-S-oxide reductase MsrB [Pseudooceanicola aestuarii]